MNIKGSLASIQYQNPVIQRIYKMQMRLQIRVFLYLQTQINTWDEIKGTMNAIHRMLCRGTQAATSMSSVRSMKK